MFRASICSWSVLALVILRPAFATQADPKLDVLVIPQEQFENVSQEGKLDLRLSLDNICVGSYRFPVFLELRADQTINSKYFGQLWAFRPVDSYIVKTSEEVMEMTLPTGVKVPLKLSPDGSLEQQGSSITRAGVKYKWKGQTIDNVAELANGIGWKLTYDNGRIQTLDSPDGTINFIYNNGQLTKIVGEKGEILLDLQISKASGCVTTMAVNNKNYRFEYTFGDLLSGVSVGGTDLFRLKFATNGTSDMLTLLETRKKGIDYEWNIKSGDVIRADGYRYQIGMAKRGQFSTVKRINSAGQTEFYRYDKTGMIEVGMSDGSIIRNYFFVSGKNLYGQRLKTERIDKDGKTTLLYQATFDQNGNIVTSLSNGIRAIKNTADGSTILNRPGSNSPDKVAPYFKYDAEGRLIEKMDSSGNIFKFRYGGSENQMSISKNGTILTN